MSTHAGFSFSPFAFLLACLFSGFHAGLFVCLSVGLLYLLALLALLASLLPAFFTRLFGCLFALFILLRQKGGGVRRIAITKQAEI